MIAKERIQVLNNAAERGGDYVLYWMQQSQRARRNPALEFAVSKANELALPLLVVFGLNADYPEANARHFTFMLQGLSEVERDLQRRGIAFVVRLGDPPAVAREFAEEAAAIVVDRGYLRHQREWRERVAERARCRVVQIEGDAVVPVETASGRLETAARTLRPRISSKLDEFLEHLGTEGSVRHRFVKKPSSDADLEDVARTVAALGVNGKVKPVRRFTEGTAQARKRLNSFVARRLDGYAENRNEPGLWQCSQMSPYLHLGQISPAEIAAKIVSSAAPKKDRSSFVEELVVRRELGLNFVTFQKHYDRYDALPAWAQTTLKRHETDRRSHSYSRAELEAGQTHDPYWNAAVSEMVHTGYMHNYMRMYWAKKILEWSANPRIAFRTALYLMNKYFLDGRDPLSYSNIAWCFGQHDRPWPEQPVFGKVRSMARSGLERKFDMDKYVESVRKLVATEAR